MAQAREAEAIFIDVELGDSIVADAELAAKLEEVCPVDIFAAKDGRVDVVEENLDECVLCELCINAAPPGKLRVLKLYDGTALERS
jgi:NAD-dependent dihydropyrimidine dehydrogenase PreA subunit